MYSDYAPPHTVELPYMVDVTKLSHLGSYVTSDHYGNVFLFGNLSTHMRISKHVAFQLYSL